MTRHQPLRRLGWRFRAGAILLAALAGSVAGCNSSSQPILIGITGPFSEARGRSMLLAAKLAVEEVNSSGMLGGRTLALDSIDDSASTVRAIAVAQELRDNPRVVAVVGHLTSGTTLAAADIYNGGRHPVVEISPSASSPDLSGIGRYTFRVCATDLVHGGVLARFALQQLGAKKAEVIYLNDDYGRGILTTFRQEFERLGGEVTDADPVLATTTDLTPYLEHIKQDDQAQVIMIAGDRTTAVTVLHQARAKGITLPIIGGDGLAGIQTEGAIADGIHITSNYLPDQTGPANAAFLRAYATVSGGTPPDHRGAGAYDAIHIIAQAIRDAGTGRSAIRDALARLGKDRPVYEGVTGRISFDDRGDVPNKSVVVGVVRGGQIVMTGQ
ncbi:MAG TPA: ABC transporter substrate-binding protein [Gemmatimonadales bacterium]